MAEQFDLIVIGAGSGARYGAQKAARDYGAKVALIERTRWGGSCPNVACKPTKAYLVVADLLHDINTIAERLGIEVGHARANLAKIKARKDSLIKPQEKWVEDLNGDGLPNRRPARRRDRGRRLDRPRRRAGADGAPGVAARSGRRGGRARIRPDVRTFRLEGHDRGRARADRA